MFFFQFEFNLYYEVKRVSFKDEPFTIMDGKKRLWMKEKEMSFEIYKQHLKPTVFNKHFKILTTQHYVPEYLRGILSKGLGNFYFNRIRIEYYLFYKSKKNVSVFREP